MTAGTKPAARSIRGRRGRPPLHGEAAVPRSPMVENTGIEPVTSWLQTRRSPS